MPHLRANKPVTNKEKVKEKQKTDVKKPPHEYKTLSE